MPEINPFLPIPREFREFLANGTKSTSRNNESWMIDLDDLDTEPKQARRAFRAPQFDIIASLPFELVALIVAYLDPVDLIVSLRVSLRLQAASPNEQVAWLNLKQ